MSDAPEEKITIGRRVSLMVDWFEVGALSLSTAALAILLIANVIARTFYQAIYFAEELAEFLVVFTTFVGVSYAARKARHIRMGAFLDSMPPKVEKVFIYVISAVSAVVMFIMAYHSWNYMLTARMMGQTTQALRMPYWITLVIVPVGFFSAGIQYVRTVWKNIREEDVWQSPEQQSEYEDEIGGY
ncbi:MAG: TRAP transporter small permease [Alkalispirochaeta sp.]